MTIATQNGTCQCCGRVQAYTARGIAKHGYTVDWGFFNGVCGGSDQKPLELDRTITDRTIVTMRDFATGLDLRAAGDILEVPVSGRTTDRNGKRVTVTVMTARENFDARAQYQTFDEAVARFRRQLASQAESIRAQASDLQALADRVHGTELKARAVEAPIRRESAPTYKAAYARCEELKAQGKLDVRQRRNSGWQGGFSITYREG